MKKRTVTLLGTVLVLPGLLGYSGPVLHAQTSTNPDFLIKAEVPSTKTISALEKQELMDEANISKEEALKVALDFLDVPSGYKQDNISFQTNWYGNNSSVWSISWSKQEENAYGYINITIDANSGNIVGMNRNFQDPDLDTSYPPKVDRDEAKTIALSLIKEQFPDIQDQLIYENYNQKTPLRGSVVYNLRFNQEVNGIPFKDNFIEVSINGNGQLVGLNYRWNNSIEFPDTSGLLTKAEATERMEATLPLRLQYRMIPGINRYYGPTDGEKRQYALEYAYENLGYGVYFDAKKGTWVSRNGEPLDENTLGGQDPLTEEPLAEEPSGGDNLTQQQAMDVFKSYVDVLDDMELQNASYQEQSSNNADSFWIFEWRNEKEQAFTYGSVNAKTGELVDFNNYRYEPQNEEVEQVLTYEEAKQKAIDAVKEMVPWKTDQITLNPVENAPMDVEKKKKFNFSFQRLVNGIPVPNQYISIAFSAETGELIRFYQNWQTNAEFPNPDSIVSKEEAKQIYFDAMDIQLEYIQPYQQDYYPIDAAQQAEDQELLLAYTFRFNQTDEPTFLDAITGAWLSVETGEPMIDTPEPTDISGHWAENALRLMLEYQAININEQGEVKPNAVATRGEIIKMMMLSSNPNPYYYREMATASGAATFNDVSADSAYFPYVEAAVREGLIDKSGDEFNPDDPVTREELAEMIVKALDYDKIADVDDMFQLDFDDAEAIENPGTVAIVSHLGIMVGSNNTFRPDENVTRAQAAQTYYAYLEKREKYGRGY
ncbi:YcdB/YcdC domain-containing protein [Aquibacillus salsiterrae]|uniref:S-layer homology domain-containing protein n=1 Tax=Aquibacillus salsiterrae TaxID=2950439 RepID=A0A9X4AF70_9BACI|nr:YcdB/YcdC domain-containing protein [Aquibacillus salsiterrae]MDC3415945.1 S-layer homology domain-containing protein [Aquibacillus salsiterrae]